MADILEARDRGRRRVAIKVLREGLSKDPEILARFHREAKAASSLKSRYVVRIYEYGTTEKNLPFIVMEYLDGNDLSRELDLRGVLPLEEAASYVAQTCHAIVEAHEAGIVHRDLKPTNLFLAHERGSRIIKVLDFGIAKLLKAPADQQITHTQTLFGSPLYMAPETFQSAKRADARSDVWSLGVMLYEMLTGTVPFQADNALAVGLSVTREAHVPPSQRRPELPRAVDVVVARALKKNPDERYQSVRELLAAIEVFMPRGRNDTMAIQQVTGPSVASAVAIARAASGAAPASGEDDPRTVRRQYAVTELGMIAPDMDTSDVPTRVAQPSDAGEAPTRVAVDPTDAPTRVRPDSEIDDAGKPTLVAPVLHAPYVADPSAVGETGRVAGPVSLSTPPPPPLAPARKRVPVVAWAVPAAALLFGLGGWLVGRGPAEDVSASRPPSTESSKPAQSAAPDPPPRATTDPTPAPPAAAGTTAVEEPAESASSAHADPEASASPSASPAGQPAGALPSWAKPPPPKKKKFTPTKI
jgi:serine/threonine-protein kinase